MAVSSTQCATSFNQKFVQGSGGFVPVEGFPGAPVEFRSDSVEVGLVVDGQVGSLGKVLPEQAVGRSYVCQGAVSCPIGGV